VSITRITRNGSSFFPKLCLAGLEGPTRIDVVHAHDWQTALVPLLMKHERERAGRERREHCVTIHNLAYQGCSLSAFSLTGLPESWFNISTQSLREHERAQGRIATADLITTVSPRYAREIHHGGIRLRLDGLLRSRQWCSRILNGVDYDEWTTTRNPSLPPRIRAKSQWKSHQQLRCSGSWVSRLPPTSRCSVRDPFG